MFHYIDRFAASFVQYLQHTRLNLGREEWVMVFFAMVLFGLVCMRGRGHRGF
jgi:hypothetical protein